MPQMCVQGNREAGDPLPKMSSRTGQVAQPGCIMNVIPWPVEEKSGINSSGKAERRLDACSRRSIADLSGVHPPTQEAAAVRPS